MNHATVRPSFPVPVGCMRGSDGSESGALNSNKEVKFSSDACLKRASGPRIDKNTFSASVISSETSLTLTWSFLRRILKRMSMSNNEIKARRPNPSEGPSIKDFDREVLEEVGCIGLIWV